MGNALDSIREHQLIAAAIGAAIVFVVGLLIGGQRSGSAAEWAAAAGAVIAAVVALYIADSSARAARTERKRQWNVDYQERAASLASELLMVIERDRVEDKDAGWPLNRRSADGVALGARLYAMGSVPPLKVLEHYESIPTRTHRNALVESTGGGSAYWDGLREDCLNSISQITTLEHGFMSGTVTPAS
jgi:gas vesicle protein